MRRPCFLIISIILFVSSLLTSCTSIEKKEAPSAPKDQGKKSVPENKLKTWEISLKVHDQKSDKKHNLSVEMITLNDTKMRLEIMGTFGTHLVSGVIEEQKISYMLPKRSEAFHGNINDDSFLPALNLRVNPKILFAITLNKSLDGWNCSLSDDKPDQCRSADGKLLVHWKSRQDKKTVVMIYGQDFELDATVTEESTKVQYDEALFRLKIPKHYTIHNL